MCGGAKVGDRIAWRDNWTDWEATIEEASGNAFFLTDVCGTDRGTGKTHEHLIYTGRDKGDIILQSMVDGEKAWVIG